MENESYIDVKAIRHTHDNSIITTPADILSNYLIGRKVARNEIAGRVIDVHMRPGSRHSVVAVLENGQTLTLYIPTEFEYVPDDIPLNMTPTNQHECDHKPYITLAAMLGFAIGCVFIAFVGW